MSRNLLSSLATGVMVACALVVTAAVVRRDLLGTPPAAAPGPDLRPRKVENWPALLAGGGQWMGRRDAPVRIVEFSDFQCPFCARAHPVLQAAIRRHPERVAVLYRHFPLDAIHPHARAAAVASECAAAQGRFEAFATLLFARQDALEARPWARFAREAGVPDSAAFARCLVSREAAARVDADARLGATTRIEVTPTLVIDGTLHPGLPTEAELEALISAASER